jgi:hypothetical protein
MAFQNPSSGICSSRGSWASRFVCSLGLPQTERKDAARERDTVDPAQGSAVVLTATAGFVWYGMRKSKVRSGAAMLPDGSRPLSSTQPGSGRVPTYSVVRLFLR